jgi:NitT/TauT family transport system permease protein
VKSHLVRFGGPCVQWIFSIAVIYAVWQWVLDPHFTPVLFASPERAMSQIRSYFDDGSLWSLIGVTISEALTGFVIGALVGLFIALLIGSMPLRYGKIFEPIIGGFYAMPKFVLAPLLFVWLGTGFGPRVVLVTIAVFPLVAIYSLTGVRTVDPNTLYMMRLAGASRWQIARMLIFPHTAGYYAMSLVVATPHALTIAIGAEILFGATTGLGGFLYTSSESFHSADVLATLVIATVLSLILFGITRTLEVRLLRSRGQLVAGRGAVAAL